MTIWNTKMAGTLYEAMSHHISTLAEPERSPKLLHWMRRAEEASCSVLTTDQELKAIRSGLCSYCIQRMQFKCEGHQLQKRCEFVEAMLDARSRTLAATQRD